MDLRRLFNSKTVLALLVLAVCLEVAALLVYSRLDNIVNVDLYSYGLRFSLAWAEDYWNTYGIAMGCLIGSIVFTGFALGPYHIYSRDDSVTSRWACILFPVIAAGYVAASLYFVFRTDSIVHGVLYQYGLQYSLGWAEGYWTIARAALALGAIAIIVLAFMSLVTWVMTRD